MPAMMTPLPTWALNDSPLPDPLGYGARAVRFLRALRHPKSPAAGRAFQLVPWQERIVRRIYGDVDEAGLRRVRNVVILLPRGNRKTSLGAGLALLHTFGPERVPRGEVIVAASDQKQAGIAYDEAFGIVQATPALERVADLRPSEKWMQYPRKGAKFEALSSDSATQHGRTPSLAIVDELHAHKKRDLWDVITTGLRKLANTLSVVITTAGRGQNGVAWEVVDYARRVARGEVDDPATLPILFEAPADADWRDEALWRAVNPGLGYGFPDLAGLRQAAREAENKPGEREAFRQLHLNVWLDHSADPFVEMAIYDEGAEPVDLAALEAEPCWLAVDLGLTTDLSVVVAAWRDDGDGYRVAAWFFCPADNLRARADRDHVPYPRWAEEGFIIPTPGNVTDHRAIELHIRELCERFNVQEIAFDPAYARAVMAPLQEDGFPVVTMRQGWITMAPAIKELERVIVGRRFRHGGNPILRWCFENVAVETDKAGNKSFHKGKSRDRIDGAVAAAMAIGRASQHDGGPSFTEQHGVFWIA